MNVEAYGQMNFSLPHDLVPLPSQGKFYKSKNLQQEIYGSKIKLTFAEAGIETRPLVSGNLLRQPFLKNYKFDVPRSIYNADIINDCGFYIGNSQFVTDADLEALAKLLHTVK